MSIPRPCTVVHIWSKKRRGFSLTLDTTDIAAVVKAVESAVASFPRRTRETGFKATRRPVKCSNGTTYPSLTAAAKAIGAPIGALSRVCNGRQHTCRGRKFEFVDQ